MTPIDPNSPLGIVTYYINLLIIQYLEKPKAAATVGLTCAPAIMPQTSTQQIAFSDVAVSGTFVLDYNGNTTVAINWNDSLSTIQSKLQTVSGLSSVTVTGSIVSQFLTVVFTGVTPPAQMLNVDSDSFENISSVGIIITITETDQTLPLAVQGAFNIIGPNIAQGVQLDVIGKYCGVNRNGNGPSGPITLNDSDFLTLIRFAIAQNNSGSSLAMIESNMNIFFPGQFLITDFKNMFMSYILSGTLGSSNLFIVLISENLIPRPMGVGISVIVPPTIENLFGFRTYDGPNNFVKGFNTYDDFNTDWIWLSYAYALT